MNVKGVLLLLVLFNLCYSSSLSEVMPEASENELTDIIYDYAIPFALLISYSIVALGFMAAKVFNSRDVEAWSKIELREVLISTMYAAIIISFFPFFNAVINEFVANTTNYQTSDLMFIELLNTAFDPIMSTMKYMFTFSSINWIGWNPTGVIGIPFTPTPTVVNISYSHYYDGKTFTNLFSLFTHTFIPILFSAMVSVMGQIIILNFFEKILFVFVGLGLAMRSFTFTRKMGGTLLAVVLGTFFLFKLLLVIETSVYLNLGLDSSVDIATSSGIVFLDVISDAISFFMEGFLQLFEVLNFPIYFYKFIADCASSNPLAIPICIVFAPFMWVIDLIMALIKIIIGVIFWAFTLVSVMIMGVVTLTDIANEVIINSIAAYSDVITFAFFMPILNFMIIIAGIKSLAETFGGDVSVVNMLTFI